MKFLFKLTGLTFVIAQFAGSPVLFGQAAPQAAEAKPKGARIQFSETIFDFGKITPASTPRHDFTVTNTGDAVLEIVAVQPGCGCTTAGDWDHKSSQAKRARFRSGLILPATTVRFRNRLPSVATMWSKARTSCQITANVYRPSKCSRRS
jgi:antitoxin (DNA-binding transcriptional repressor) of toxin-antitoxin stability system